jgi:hypothetical protein
MIDTNTAGSTNSKYLSGAIDPIGGGIVAGGYYKTNPGALTQPLVSKISSTGANTWSRSPVASTGFWIARTGVSSSTGAVAATGQVPTVGGGYNAITVYYNSSGVLQWQRQFADTQAGASQDDFGSACVVDASDNVYTAGYYKTSANAGSKGALLLKYNSSGTLQWNKVLIDVNGVNTSYAHFLSVVVDTSGNVYAAGYTREVGLSSYYALVVKFDSSGNLIWAKTYPTAGSAYYFHNVAVDTSGNVYASGNHGDKAIFVVKLSSSGAAVSGRVITASGAGIVNTFNTVSPNNLYVNSASGDLFIGATLTPFVPSGGSSVILRTTTDLPAVGTTYGSATGNGLLTVSNFSTSTSTWGGSVNTLGTSTTSTLITDAVAGVTLTTTSSNNTLVTTD